MYIRDLHEPQHERLEQAARAILAAVYDPLTTQANWGDIHQLNDMSFQRLMRIADLAVENWKAQTAPGDVVGSVRDEINSSEYVFTGCPVSNSMPLSAARAQTMAGTPSAAEIDAADAALSK